MGFLVGAPGDGTGDSLVQPGVAVAGQRMTGATAYFITPGVLGTTTRVNYHGKIGKIGKLITTGLGGAPHAFPYLRPYEGQGTVRVTLEFCTASRQLRVMISDYRFSDVNGNPARGGVRVIDMAIP